MELIIELATNRADAKMGRHEGEGGGVLTTTKGS